MTKKPSTTSSVHEGELGMNRAMHLIQKGKEYKEKKEKLALEKSKDA